jgi:hypothetical protein
MNRPHAIVNLNTHSVGLTPGEAWARRGRTLYTHRRLPEDNESTGCGAREGAATLNPEEVTCPDLRCKRSER